MIVSSFFGIFQYPPSYGGMRALKAEYDADILEYVISRLSRIQHNSLQWSLATFAHDLSSLSMQQHTDIAGRLSSLSPAAICGEERDVTDVRAGKEYLATSDSSISGGPWLVPRKQAMVKRTIGVTTSILEGFLGTIRATSTTTLQESTQIADLKPFREEDQYGYKTSYTVYPAPWLVRLGIHYGLNLGFLSSPTQGWKNTLKSFCPVPDDALIFEFCRQGNVPAVRTLISGGHASVRDTDSEGYTPLHVSFTMEIYLTRY